MAICKGEECDRVLVSPSYFYRDKSNMVGVFAHRGHGLCGRCLTRLTRNGTTAKPIVAPRPPRGSQWRPLEETLEDWAKLRGSHTVEQAAERMNMSASALSKALERARARGDKRGNIPGVNHKRPA